MIDVQPEGSTVIVIREEREVDIAKLNGGKGEQLEDKNQLRKNMRE